MGKATVLNCDMCGVWDSAEMPVRTVGICGPKFDLCQKDRVGLLTSLGVSPEKATAYVAMYDARQAVRGTKPTLAAVKDAVGPESEEDDDDSDEIPELQAVQDGPEGNGESPAEIVTDEPSPAVVDGQEEAQTEVKPAGSRRRR